MKKYLLLPVLFTSLLSFSQTMNDINIVPQPVEIKKAQGEFLLNTKTCILAYEDEQTRVADELNFYLKQLYGFTLSVKNMKTIFSFHHNMPKAIPLMKDID
jgi:hypothetical protein